MALFGNLLQANKEGRVYTRWVKVKDSHGDMHANPNCLLRCLQKHRSCGA